MEQKRSILLSLLSALVLAVLIFYTIVMPVEFGKDPLGTGKLLGLPNFTSSNSSAKTKEPARRDATDLEGLSQAADGDNYAFRKDKVEILVPANRGVEYKFNLKQYGNLVYQWQADADLYFDFHGEPKGDTTGYFESYTIATAEEMEGSMTMPFEGVHGWYWKNASDIPITIILTTQGNYEVKGQIK